MAYFFTQQIVIKGISGEREGCPKKKRRMCRLAATLREFAPDLRECKGHCAKLRGCSARFGRLNTLGNNAVSKHKAVINALNIGNHSSKCVVNG